MDDAITYALLTATFFFVALAFALLVRYRQASERINKSTDLGRDLWSSLERRLKKQDERILDMMGRLEVIQARVMTTAVPSVPTSLASVPPMASSAAPTKRELSELRSSAQVQQPVQQESQKSRSMLAPVQLKLDRTQLAALVLLRDGPKAVPQMKNLLKKSREHTARLMKELYDLGLVGRNDSSKPFVYQLTDEGNRLIKST